MSEFQCEKCHSCTLPRVHESGRLRCVICNSWVTGDGHVLADGPTTEVVDEPAVEVESGGD